MKTILCPVDFSMSSEKVARYAAQLARDTDSKVTLMAIQKKKQVLVVEGEHEDQADLMDKLGEMHDVLKVDYKVSCGMEDHVIVGDVNKKVSTFADQYDLTVLGAPRQNERRGFTNTNGINLIKTIQHSLAPLLIVPDNFRYEVIKKLTYAFDYSHEPDVPLAQLHWLAQWFKAEVKFISILNYSSDKEEERLNSTERDIRKKWRSGVKISFDSIVYDKVAICLDHYTKLWSENNLLVLSVNHQNILEKIWHKSVIKQLLHNCKNPYLILHK